MNPKLVCRDCGAELEDTRDLFTKMLDAVPLCDSCGKAAGEHALESLRKHGTIIPREKEK